MAKKKTTKTPPPPPQKHNIEAEHSAMIALLRVTQLYFDAERAGEPDHVLLFMRPALIATIRSVMETVTGHAEPQPNEENV